MLVLVVDDSAFQRRHIVKLLPEGIGLRTLEAADGKQALELLDAGHRPHILLTDWNMPNMNGLALVQAVRRRPEFDRTKVLMITTENDPWSVRQALEAGADDYLMKPFDAESLRAKLQMLLRTLVSSLR